MGSGQDRVLGQAVLNLDLSDPQPPRLISAAGWHRGKRTEVIWKRHMPLVGGSESGRGKDGKVVETGFNCEGRAQGTHGRTHERVTLWRARQQSQTKVSIPRPAPFLDSRLGSWVCKGKPLSLPRKQNQPGFKKIARGWPMGTFCLLISLMSSWKSLLAI